MKTNLLKLAVLVFVMSAFLVSCNKAPKEYIADDDTYEIWETTCAC